MILYITRLLEPALATALNKQCEYSAKPLLKQTCVWCIRVRTDMCVYRWREGEGLYFLYTQCADCRLGDVVEEQTVLLLQRSPAV